MKKFSSLLLLALLFSAGCTDFDYPVASTTDTPLLKVDETLKDFEFDIENECCDEMVHIEGIIRERYAGKDNVSRQIKGVDLTATGENGDVYHGNAVFHDTYITNENGTMVYNQQEHWSFASKGGCQFELISRLKSTVNSNGEQVTWYEYEINCHGSGKGRKE